MKCHIFQSVGPLGVEFPRLTNAQRYWEIHTHDAPLPSPIVGEIPTFSRFFLYRRVPLMLYIYLFPVVWYGGTHNSDSDLRPEDLAAREPAPPSSWLQVGSCWAVGTFYLPTVITW